MTTEKRETARRSEVLQCKVGALKVVGLTAINAEGGPAASSVQTCPHITTLLQTVSNKCDGHQSCSLKASEIGVAKNQCPGVSSVNFRVRCIKPVGEKTPLVCHVFSFNNRWFSNAMVSAVARDSIGRSSTLNRGTPGSSCRLAKYTHLPSDV